MLQSVGEIIVQNYDGINVFFVGMKNKCTGSYKMRAVDLAPYLNDMGLNVHLVYTDQIYSIGKSENTQIFIFVKPVRIDFSVLKYVKETIKGVVIFDCVDVEPYRKMVNIYKEKKYVDGFIFPNEHVQNKCVEMYPEKHNKYDALIYHHASMPTNITKPNTLNFCYYGGKKYRISNVDDIDNVVFTKHGYDVAAGYHCHVSFRNCLYKPNTKISMAANCESNIIINENSGGVETLPSEYSYIYMWQYGR